MYASHVTTSTRLKLFSLSKWKLAIHKNHAPKWTLTITMIQFTRLFENVQNAAPLITPNLNDSSVPDHDELRVTEPPWPRTIGRTRMTTTIKTAKMPEHLIELNTSKPFAVTLIESFLTPNALPTLPLNARTKALSGSSSMAKPS